MREHLPTNAPDPQPGDFDAELEHVDPRDVHRSSGEPAVLRVVDAQSALSVFFGEELGLSDAERDARDNRWAELGAHEAVREEPW